MHLLIVVGIVLTAVSLGLLLFFFSALNWFREELEKENLFRREATAAFRLGITLSQPDPDPHEVEELTTQYEALAEKTGPYYALEWAIGWCKSGIVFIASITFVLILVSYGVIQ